ncbi:hypothetical protein GCM10027088_30580 [Nocardia goodfellowii]
MRAVLLGAVITVLRQLWQAVGIEIDRGGETLLGSGEAVPDLIAKQDGERLGTGHVVDVTG